MAESDPTAEWFAWKKATDALVWGYDDATPPILLQPKSPYDLLTELFKLYADKKHVRVTFPPGYDIVALEQSPEWATVVGDAPAYLSWTFGRTQYECVVDEEVSFILGTLRSYPELCEKIVPAANRLPEIDRTIQTPKKELLDLVYWMSRLTAATPFESIRFGEHYKAAVSKWCGIIASYETALPLVRYFVAHRARYEPVHPPEALWENVRYFRAKLPARAKELTLRRLHWIERSICTTGVLPTQLWAPIEELRRCTDHRGSFHVAVVDKMQRKIVTSKFVQGDVAAYLGAISACV